MDETTPAATDPLADAGLAPAPADAPAVPVVPAPVEPAVEVPAAEPAEAAVVAQAKNPDAVQALIDAERKTAREANAKARELKAQLEAQTDASKPLEEQVTDSNKKAAEAELRATRLEVAAEAGIDLKLASRLSGATREELLADAEAFKPLIGATAPTPTVPPEGGVRTTPAAKKDPVKDHNNLLAEALGRRSASPGQSFLSGLEPAPIED